MNRQDFIKLLEEYKQKALDNLRQEIKVTAALLISDELRESMRKYEKAAATVNSMLNQFAKEAKIITKENQLTDKAYFYQSEATVNVEAKVLEYLCANLTHSQAYIQKKNEICDKFNQVIAAAKATRSADKLKTIADSIGIQINGIDIAPLSEKIDTKFVKEKIQSVLLLK